MVVNIIHDHVLSTEIAKKYCFNGVFFKKIITGKGGRKDQAV